MNKFLLSSILMTLVSCAYFPDGREVWQSVPLVGVISSCIDGRAIEAALVKSSNHKETVNTDINGNFRINGKRATLHLAGLSDSYQEGLLTVSAVGYVRLEQKIRYSAPSHKEKVIDVKCMMTLQS